MSTGLRHHPGEESLLAYAAGTLEEASSILVASHLALCPNCRAVSMTAEIVGGELLDRSEPAATTKITAAETLALIDRESDIQIDAPKAQDTLSANHTAADDVLMPQPLRDYVPGGLSSLKWRWMGPGVKYANIVGDKQTGKVGLLRIAPGTRLPRHGHTDEEFTMVLSGSYDSADHRYRRGDVEWADNAVVHQPTASRDCECICVVVTRGSLRATGLLAPIIQRLMAI